MNKILFFFFVTGKERKGNKRMGLTPRRPTETKKVSKQPQSLLLAVSTFPRNNHNCVHSKKPRTTTNCCCRPSTKQTQLHASIQSFLDIKTVPGLYSTWVRSCDIFCGRGCCCHFRRNAASSSEGQRSIKPLLFASSASSHVSST